MFQDLSALVLAAGFGTRLKPITNDTPKCLVKVRGKPILERWLYKLAACGCSNVIINTHHHADQVHEFVQQFNSGTAMNITCSYEHEILGTAGSLMANRRSLCGKYNLLIHADNDTSFDLRELLDAHINRPQGCLLTMLTFNSECPSQCGIVSIDDRGIVREFHEKVTDPPGHRANAAIYVFDSELFDFLDIMNEAMFDFSVDVIPRLLGKIFAFHTDKCLLDIGTMQNLNRANQSNNA